MCKGLATLPATCLKGAIEIKHKISFLHQKSEAQAAHQKPAKEKSDAAAKSVKDIKHKISILLQKSEHPAAAQKLVKVKTAAKSGPTAAEVEAWKESFSSMMNSERGCEVFSSFLRSEFSEENIEFWVACRDYQKTPATKIATKAKQIYNQYVAADSPNEVNLDAATREQTKQNLKSACPACFEEAQKKIYILMEKDSYRRFLNSKLLQDLAQTCSETVRQTEQKLNSRVGNRQVLAGAA